MLSEEVKEVLASIEESRNRNLREIIKTLAPSQQSRWMGLSSGDIIKGVVWIIIGAGLFFKMDYRVSGLEKLSLDVNTRLLILESFRNNSDKFNSARYGYEFEGGRPVNYQKSFKQETAASQP